MGKVLKADTDNAAAGSIDSLLGYNLKRAYMIFRDDFRNSVENAGMTPRAMSVLAQIVEMPMITQSDVARRLGIERSGLVAIIDELEKGGLVRRAAVPGDRRSQALVPTAQGHKRIRAILQQVQAHEANLLSPLNPQEQAQLLHMLRKLRHAHGNDSTP
ncbi:MarR family winged helix-turn-helix transcriptional regulator [Roseinatronobacter alkalisoli]|uniref:MarR family transcriptional regulator n=1 Tax=Roseinatronobacter alkalisoli TaxID=3028235 RepID=A0ABT5TBC8_9RHOB|nr:MarR family transcriptional regulator [Roseinatronobacter sp. HJB301]MDD7972428.1 MarR family transcriptional regulator [Roseinatronobacter sp. HJB301]